MKHTFPSIKFLMALSLAATLLISSTANAFPRTGDFNRPAIACQVVLNIIHGPVGPPHPREYYSVGGSIAIYGVDAPMTPVSYTDRNEYFYAQQSQAYLEQRLAGLKQVLARACNRHNIGGRDIQCNSMLVSSSTRLCLYHKTLGVECTNVDFPNYELSCPF